MIRSIRNHFISKSNVLLFSSTLFYKTVFGICHRRILNFLCLSICLLFSVFRSLLDPRLQHYQKGFHYHKRNVLGILIEEFKICLSSNLETIINLKN